jgi:predicted dehydrogenase
MSLQPLTIAIVGCGQFAEEHVKEIRKICGVEVVAVCDREPLMAEQLAERHRIPRQYASLEAMYAEITPDVAHITTPPQTHLQLGRYACEHGSHIYVEKPFTVNYNEAFELVKAAEACGRKVTVGHIYHFDPPIMKMRQLVAQGVLGEPVHVEALMGYSLEGSFGKAFVNNRNHWIYSLPGQLFQNIISHLVYKVLEFLPDETPTVQVYAALRNRTLRERNVDLLDELRVILSGRNVTAYLTFSASLSPTLSLLRVYGTKSTIEVDLNCRHVIVRPGKQLPTAIGKLAAGLDLTCQQQRNVWRNFNAFLRSEFQFTAGMNQLLRLFYASIQDNSALPIPYEDILRTTRAMDLIFEQLPTSQLPPLQRSHFHDLAE